MNTWACFSVVINELRGLKFAVNSCSLKDVDIKMNTWPASLL